MLFVRRAHVDPDHNHPDVYNHAHKHDNPVLDNSDNHQREHRVDPDGHHEHAVDEHDADDDGDDEDDDKKSKSKKGKGKPMGMDWTPLLHPPLTVSDENGQATTEALRRSALEGIQALSETEDPAQIGRMLTDLRNAETLFSDGATRERVKTVLARAKEIKTASEQKDHGKAMIARKGGAKDKTAHMNKTADAIREKVTAKAGMAESMRGLTHTITFTSEDLRKAGDLGKAMRKNRPRSEPA